MNFFKKILGKRTPQQVDPAPGHLSELRLSELIAEHRFICATLAHLSSSFPTYARQHGNDSTTFAISSLKAKKVELEAKIEVLRHFLNSTSS
jgi:hypothetical protein